MERYRYVDHNDPEFNNSIWLLEDINVKDYTINYLMRNETTGSLVKFSDSEFNNEFVLFE